MIIERLGKYHTTLKPGVHWVWPIIESPRMINWRYLNVKVAQPTTSSTSSIFCFLTPCRVVVMHLQHNHSGVDVVSVQTDRVDMREHGNALAC